jgi:hypothetical protein
MDYNDKCLVLGMLQLANELSGWLYVLHNPAQTSVGPSLMTP